MFEIQNFVITAALDEQGFSAADPNVREKILNCCIETIKADTTNRFVKGTKKGRVDRTPALSLWCQMFWFYCLIS